MRLRVESDAEEELTAAAEWYESRRAGLGVELVAVIDGALEAIVAATGSPRPSQPFYDAYFEDHASPLNDTFESKGVDVVVDPLSLQYLDGTTIDYVAGTAT